MTDIDWLNPGILLIVSLIAIYGISFFAYLKGRIYIALLFIIFAGFGLRIFCSLDPMLHPWDERYHALVSKNIIEEPFEPKLYKDHIIEYDFKNWQANKIWLHKQPMSLWIMALNMKVFGISEFTLRLPSVFLSTLSIFLTFCIGLILFKSARIGLIAAFFHSINGLVIEISSGRVATDHVDTFFLFFIELSILFILLNVKNSNRIFLVLAGIACGFAILSKWLPALIIFPLYLMINIKGRSISRVIIDLLILSIMTVLVALPWQLYAQSQFPLEYQWEQYFNNLHFTEALEGHGQPWWYFFKHIRISVNELIFIILLWFGYYTVKNNEFRRENLFLMSYIAIPFLVFSIAATKMQGYLLFTYPAYFIIMALFIEKLLNRNNSDFRQSRFYKLNIFIVVVILSLAVRYGYERVKPFENYENEWLAKKELKSINFPLKSVLFNIYCPIELMFYTNCIGYPIQPDNDLITKLQEQNYNLFIVDDGYLTVDLINDSRIEKIKIPATLRICDWGL